jgi:hypothetical protein
MVWCLVKHRDNFTFTFTVSLLFTCLHQLYFKRLVYVASSISNAEASSGRPKLFKRRSSFIHVLRNMECVFRCSGQLWGNSWRIQNSTGIFKRSLDVYHSVIHSHLIAKCCSPGLRSAWSEFRVPAGALTVSLRHRIHTEPWQLSRNSAGLRAGRSGF